MVLAHGRGLHGALVGARRASPDGGGGRGAARASAQVRAVSGSLHVRRSLRRAGCSAAGRAVFVQGRLSRVSDDTPRQMRIDTRVRGVVITALIAGYGFLFRQPQGSFAEALL